MLVVLGAVGAEGQVEHPDVEAVGLPVRDHPVDGGQHLADVGGARGVGDLDADQPGVGRHADEVLLAAADGGRDLVVPTGDEAGHVGAVAVGVLVAQVVVLRLEGQVRPVQRPCSVPRRPSTGTVPGVDQGDVDALAGVAGVPVAGGAEHVLLDLAVGAEVTEGRVVGARVGV